MNIAPGGGSIWSEFGQDFQYLLYSDRSKQPKLDLLDANRAFLLSHRDKYSLGGTNNLNNDWNETQWQDYFTAHKGNYQELDLDLDF